MEADHFMASAVRGDIFSKTGAGYRWHYTKNASGAVKGIDYGFVEKKSFEGYPLHVEYSLTKDMGERILEALRIM